MKLRKNINTKLPEWFDLDNYSNSSVLSHIDFGLNLVIRFHIHKSFSVGSDRKIEPEFVKEYISLIKNHGIVNKDLLSDLYDEFVKGLNYSQKGYDQGAGLGVVLTLPTQKAYEIYEAIHKDTLLRSKLSRVDYYKNLPYESEAEEYFSEWFEEDFQKEAFFNSGTSLSEHSFENIVLIDVNASDERLIEGFRDWLNSYRAIHKHEKVSNTDDKLKLKELDILQRKWVEASILPYMDLRMHEKLEDVKFTQHAVGNAIFQPTKDIDTTEVVRKTTKRHALVALNNAFIFTRKAIIESDN